MRVFSFFSRNKAFLGTALAGAIFVSLLHGLPHILISKKLAAEGRRYVPVTLYADNDEAQLYAPQIEEAAGGKFFFGDLALKEYQHTPSFLPKLNPFILGSMARFVGMERLWIAFDLFLPPLIFLVLFGILRMVTGTTFLAVALGLLFIFTREFVSFIPFSTWHQFKAFAANFKPILTDTVATRLPLDRMFSPEWTFVPLGIFFLAWIAALRKPTAFRFILAGISYGILFYTYPYDWMSVSVMVVAQTLLTLIFARDISLSKYMGLLFLTGLAVSVPYWVSFFAVRALPQYGELLARTGLEVGRTVRWLFFPQFILWAGLAVWLLKGLRRKDPLCLGAASIFIASIILMNIQMVTGYVPQPDHFLRYPLLMALFIAYVIAAVAFIGHYGRYMVRWKKPLIAVLTGLVLLVIGRNVQIPFAYARDNAWRYTLPLAVDESFRWMRRYVRPDAVVLSLSVVTNTHLLIFTPAKVFVPASGVISVASDRELVERFVIAAKFFGMPDEDIVRLFRRDFLMGADRGEWSEDIEDRVAAHLLHYGLYQQGPGTYFTGNELRPLDDLTAMVEDVLDVWRTARDRLLKKYAIDYIYVGPHERSRFLPESDQFPLCAEKVFSRGEVELYRVCDEH